MNLCDEEVAQRAAAFGALELEMLIRTGIIHRPLCSHIVIFDPKQPYYPGRTNGLPILYEVSIGKAEWPQGRHYDVYARAKAMLSWQHHMDSRLVQQQAHLMGADDCIYAGAVYVNGMVVGWSGVEAYFDEMLARNVAHRAITFAEHRRYLDVGAPSPSACGAILPKDLAALPGVIPTLPGGPIPLA